MTDQWSYEAYEANRARVMAGEKVKLGEMIALQDIEEAEDETVLKLTMKFTRHTAAYFRDLPVKSSVKCTKVRVGENALLDKYFELNNLTGAFLVESITELSTDD